MIVEHYGIKVDIPPAQFGNETDIQIRDTLAKLTPLLRKTRVPIPKQKEKVTAIMVTLQHLVKRKHHERDNTKP